MDGACIAKLLFPIFFRIGRRICEGYCAGWKMRVFATTTCFSSKLLPPVFRLRSMRAKLLRDASMRMRRPFLNRWVFHKPTRFGFKRCSCSNLFANTATRTAKVVSCYRILAPHHPMLHKHFELPFPGGRFCFFLPPRKYIYHQW